MPSKDPRVDTYIAKAAPFAHPILKYIRDRVHAACPDVQETIKWNMPFFEYHGLFCYMPAFKQHCAFGFWRDITVLRDREKDSSGQLGRIKSLDDLPPKKEFFGLIKAAVAERDAPNRAPGRNAGAAKKKAKAPIAMPRDFSAALTKASGAKKKFDHMSPSHRREYVEWITGAKRPETRIRRIATAVEWISEGKSQNWRYE